MRSGVRIGRKLAAGLSVCVFAATAVTMVGDGIAGTSERARPIVGAVEADFETFLDRLMRAESNGRAFAANPRSTALGPFQFIKATFIEVARRHFPELASLGDEDLLALRTDRAVARRAAAVYSMENLAYLTGKGLDPSLGDLRLAYLVGPTAAAHVLQAPPETSAVDILGASVIRANPFMAGMSTSQLAARSARDVGEYNRASVAIAPEPYRRDVSARPGPRVRPPTGATPPMVVTCNRKLASCRRWIVLQANKQRHVLRQRAASRAARAAAKAGRALSKREARPGV